MATTTSARILTLSIWLALCAGAARVHAQIPPGENIPFFPPGIAGTPDQFFDKLFGTSSEEEERALQKIDISAKDEREFGQPQVEAYIDLLKQQGIRVLRKGKEVEYLSKLVKTLRPFMKNARRYSKITVLVVEAPRVDARSFPGGTLFFYQGLLSFADSEAALVGIVGHELSHLDRGHLVLPLQRARLIQQGTGGEAFDPQTFFATTRTMMRMTSRPFRPEDEAAADADGAEWAYRAGYDPRELAQLFHRLHERHDDPKLPFGTFFRTHPYSDDRAEAVLKHFDELERQAPHESLYRGKKNLSQRIPKSEQEFNE